MSKLFKLTTLLICIFYLFCGVQGYDFVLCHSLDCSSSQFSCQCQRNNGFPSFLSSVTCIPKSWQCDGWRDCPDGSDEIDCNCEEGMIQCGCNRGGGCPSDVIYECIDPSQDQCSSQKTTNRDCEDPTKHCDGNIDCAGEDGHDEMNCTSCPPHRPNRCACNKPGKMTCHEEGPTCYPDEGRCDGFQFCADGSDEIGCPCLDDEFKCRCYDKESPSCPLSRGCIPLSQLNDGVQQCPDGSDETPFANTILDKSGNVTLWRFSDSSQCNRTRSCDNDTCFDTISLHCSVQDCQESDTICTSVVDGDHRRGFQCADGSLLVSSQFCDYDVDCPDGSDETRNEPGFKCSGDVGVCVLPQRNLFDDVPHCRDGSDLCFDGHHRCRTCLDNRLLISSQQVCDGVADCYDWSDECLCNNTRADDSRCRNFTDSYDSLFLPIATLNRNLTRLIDFEAPQSHGVTNEFNIAMMTCQTKWGIRKAVQCDGRPECRDFSDECGCDNPPQFCNDVCHAFYPLGDRYCNGFEDEAWMYINDSACPKGFDERYCPKRLPCKAGERVSIDVNEICNGIVDCDNGIDELYCLKNGTLHQHYLNLTLRLPSASYESNESFPGFSVRGETLNTADNYPHSLVERRRKNVFKIFNSSVNSLNSSKAEILDVTTSSPNRSVQVASSLSFCFTQLIIVLWCFACYV